MDHRRQLAVRSNEVGKLVQDDDRGSVRTQAQQRVDSRGPRAQLDRTESPDVLTENLAETAERVRVSRLGCAEVEAARFSCQLVEQQGLALATTAGDDPQGRSRSLVGGEPGKVVPLEVPGEDVVGLDGKRDDLQS